LRRCQCRQNLVEDRQRVIAFKDQHRPMAHPAEHPRGQARLAERPHAVNKHPGAIAERAQHRLDRTPPADELRPRRHRHAVPVKERPLLQPPSIPALQLTRRAQRTAAEWPEIDPGQMPMPPTLAVLTMLLQQRPTGHRRRPGHWRTAPQFAIEHLREVGRIAVVNRAVPAHHVGNLCRQLAGKRGGNLRTDVAWLPHPVPLHIGLYSPIARIAPPNAIHCAARPADLSHTARRRHHQRGRRGPERLRDLPRVDQIGLALGRLKQQHRSPALVDIAMTGQMYRLERTLLRCQSTPEKRQRAGLLDNHVHARRRA
jgi:hypothetical protein